MMQLRQLKSISTIGFTKELPTTDSPRTQQLVVIGLLLYYGMPIVGWCCNLIAMHFYELDKAKMEEIQGTIDRIKAGAEEA